MLKYNKFIVLSLSLFIISCGIFSDKTKEEIAPKASIYTVSNDVVIDSTRIFKLNSVVGKSKKMIGSRSLGNAQTGEILSDNFTLLNCGDKIVVILDITTNCACLKLDFDKKPMKKDEKATVRYTYDTKGKKGSQFSELTIKTNIGNYIVLVDLFVK